MVIQFFSLTLSSLLAISLLSSVVAAAIIPYVVRAYAHFVGGETKAIGNYKVQLLLSPSKPVVGNNSTKLNFSILNKDENKDIKSIFAALTIKEKNSGETVHQFPFKLYRFSDITIPYTFPNNTDYQLVLQTKISSDPRYENIPLVAVFDISAVNPIFSPGFDQFIIYYVIIPSATVAGIILGLILVTYKRKHIHHF